MVRLFVDESFKVGERLRLSDEERRYFEKVHRSPKAFELFNSKGEIASGSYEQGFVVIERVDVKTSTSFELTVAVAVPDKAILADLVRMASELGVMRLVFFRAQRSQYQLESKDRLDRIAIEACRQSQRAAPLVIEVASSLLEVRAESARLWVLDELQPDDAAQSSKLSASDQPIVLFVGPEGGWSDEERRHFQQHGFDRIHFSTPILRVSTAACAGMMYALQHLQSFKIVHTSATKG